jgi:superfamily I DNA and RNA helicase
VDVKPYFDYIFVDEGQDFPSSFMQLCHKFAHGGRFVVGYDDLQTIFQARTPDSGQFFGVNEKGEPRDAFEEDVVLHKCYRNPREVLLTAHAVGFGIYGKKIVQMLESPEHWRDVGYEVVEGDFLAGSMTRIERPVENSLTVMSDNASFAELIIVSEFNEMNEEVNSVSESIKNDLNEGLNPEDILVVCLDDRYAKSYLQSIEMNLGMKLIACNNLHSDAFGIRDFTKEGRVTLSTVHKAKGNESFMVYAIGCDATMAFPNVRNRNMLFTAMTRAKGWLRMSGVGGSIKALINEVNKVESKFPFLEFPYPNEGEIQMMKRDLAEAADKKMRKNRLMDQLQSEYSDDEINEMLMLTKKSPRRRKNKDL